MFTISFIGVQIRDYLVTARKRIPIRSNLSQRLRPHISTPLFSPDIIWKALANSVFIILYTGTTDTAMYMHIWIWPYGCTLHVYGSIQCMYILIV
jgi:hypothetical protein